MAEILEIQRGNPLSTVITVTDEDGNAYDLTGKTVFFTVKNQDDNEDDDTDALIEAEITSHSDPTGGITVLELDDTDTDIALGDYKWDLRIYESGVTQVNSVSGICSVVDIVTKRTA